MQGVVIVSAARTPVGTFGGAFIDTLAVKLAAVVIREAIRRAGIEPDQVDEVLMGNVLQAGLGQSPTRQAALEAGLPQTVPATTVNKVCGSGLKAVTLAAQAIACSDAEVVVAGGMENMTMAPYLLPKARYGYRMGDGEVVDSMVLDGLTCAMNQCHMGITAENLAARYGIAREEQDEFAALSQAKAAKAIDEGLFAEEIVPIEVLGPKGQFTLVERDEHPRPGTTAERLSNLRAAFKGDGTVTAGNASGINDGAAAVVVVSSREAVELGLKPLARIVGYASAGVDPKIVGIGPVPATLKVLQRTGVSLDAIDLIEANEAFAAQSLAVGRELKWDLKKVNVHGGAIALGHPIGAGGARILVTLLHGMKRYGAETGLATLCIGGGQGIAMIVQQEA